jgi:hypothetical protein
MPGITGLLDDNALELVSQFLGHVADLPFNAYFVADADIALPEVQVSRPSAAMVTGTRWPAVQSTPWPAVFGRPWTPRGGA